MALERIDLLPTFRKRLAGVWSEPQSETIFLPGRGCSSRGPQFPTDQIASKSKGANIHRLTAPMFRFQKPFNHFQTMSNILAQKDLASAPQPRFPLDLFAATYGGTDGRRSIDCIPDIQTDGKDDKSTIISRH
jgi:hypothetical protein